MTKPNFEAMTQVELRAYVLEHRNDIDAFHALMDKLQAQPGIKVRSLDHLAKLIQAKQENPME
jgi:hypothetical protein